MSTEKKVFDAYGLYYDLLYEDKEYQLETEYIHDVLKENNCTGNNILEFGSGTGIHGQMLADKGFKVEGVELSEKMVKKAKTSDNFSCFQGDIREVRTEKKYDAVISLFHVINYQTTNKDLTDVFVSANKHLQKDGLFIFDSWYTPAVISQIPEVRIKRMSNKDLNVIRIAEPTIRHNENIVDVKFTIIASDKNIDKHKMFEETHSMRHYSIPEISFHAEKNGFMLVGTEEFLTKKKPSENTWGVTFIIKKVET